MRTTPCQTIPNLWTATEPQMSARMQCWGCWRVQACAAETLDTDNTDTIQGMWAGIYVPAPISGTHARAKERGALRAHALRRLRDIAVGGNQKRCA
jgi:hypothetical protein